VTRTAVDVRPLGLARVLLGALVLLRTTPLLAPFHPPFLSGASPLLGWPTHEWHFAATGLGLPDVAVAALCVVRTLAATLFAAGVRAREAGVAGALAGWLVLAQDESGYINTLHLLYMGMAVLAVAGSGAAAALRPERAVLPESGVLLLRAFVASVYAWSGIAKLNASWLAGEALASFHAQGIVRGPLVDALLASHAGQLVCAWGVAALEIALGPLLLVRRTRRVAVVLALALHALLEVTVHPDVFGFAMAALLVGCWARGAAPSSASGAASSAC
jgi:hypothetical protein